MCGATLRRLGYTLMPDRPSDDGRRRVRVMAGVGQETPPLDLELLRRLTRAKNMQEMTPFPRVETEKLT